MNKQQRIFVLNEIKEHFQSYLPNDDVPLSQYSEDEKREKEFCEALSEAVHDLVYDDDYYRTQDIKSLLEQKYDSKIVEAAMSNPEFIKNTLQRFDKTMSNDDSWVSALEYAIKQNIKLVPEILQITEHKSITNGGAKMRFFIDMDGTLAKWNNVEFEQLFEKGYYKNLEPNKDILSDVNKLIEQGEDVYILSCVLPESKYALEEKKEWLKQYVPSLPEDKYIFVPYGDNKADYLREHYSPITNKDYLIDDYTKNLVEWKEYGGIGVKYLNGINHTKGTWDGLMVYDNKIYNDNLSAEYQDKDNLSVGLTDLVIGERLRDYEIDMIASYAGYGKGDQRFSCIYKSEFYYVKPVSFQENNEYLSVNDAIKAIRIELIYIKPINISSHEVELKHQYYSRHYPTLSECNDFDKLVSQLDNNTLDDMEYSVYLWSQDNPRKQYFKNDRSLGLHTLVNNTDNPRVNSEYVKWANQLITTDDLIAEIKGEKPLQKKLTVKEQITKARQQAQQKQIAKPTKGRSR